MIRGITEERGRDNKRLLFPVLSGILAKKCGMCTINVLPPRSILLKGPYKCQKCLPTSSTRYGAHILLRFDLVVVLGGDVSFHLF